MTKEKKQRPVRNSTIRNEITLALTGIIVLISFSFTAIDYVRAKWDYRSQLRSHLEEMANSVAQCIDADVHAKLKKPEDMESESYSNLYLKLLDFKRAFRDIRYVYTMRVDGNKIRYVIDADDNIEQAMALGSVYEEADETLVNKVTQLRSPASDDEFTKDKWGTWLSGYAPLITSDNKYDGFVGVDMAASQVEAKERTLFRSAILQMIIALVFALACGQILGGFFSTPIESMILRIKRIRQGNFSDVHESTQPNEIGELSDQLNLMTEKIGTEIESLKNELEQEKARISQCMIQSKNVLALLHHSGTPFLLLDNLTVVDCNTAALQLFKAGHRINLLTRQWSELSAEASRDNHLEEQMGTPINWKFFDLTGEPFTHLIELIYISDQDSSKLLICFVSYTDTTVEAVES